MRRKITLALAVTMLFSSISCGRTYNVSSNDNSASVAINENKTSVVSEMKTAALEPVGTDSENNILIVYFSRFGNTEYTADVDATSSASIVENGGLRYGTTEYLAEMIQQAVGGDVYLIETANAYTTDFDELRDINHNEMNSGFLPELKDSNLDVAKYDTVFVGYPVWATEVPQAVISFLNQYDLSDKTVIPFCTHAGYGAGSSFSTIAKSSHAQNMLNGLAVNAEDVKNAKNTVADWLESIGFSQNQNAQENTEISITVGNTILDGVIYDTTLAREILEQLPLTVIMVGYGGREYYDECYTNRKSYVRFISV
jgi:flavodoxin